MGKDYWRSWGGGTRAAKRGRSGGAHNRDSTSTSTSTSTSASTSAGCMSAVFQFFDFHHHHLPFAFHPQVPSSEAPPYFLPDEPDNLKGVEAPRNSLEMEETFVELASNAPTKKEEQIVNIPMSIQIRTTVRSKAGTRTDDLSSESGESPAANTPSLVARLMGLDPLPGASSPASAVSSAPNKSNLNPLKRRDRILLDRDVSGCRSLPETPRISLARRSESDVDRHRFSLQINKENVYEDLEFSRSSINTSFTKYRRREGRYEDEIKSPGHYARQIVKQVKESVSRKVGLDVTNIIRNRDNNENRDDDIVLLKSKRSSRGLSRNTDDESIPSCSPRLRFLELKSKPSVKNPPPPPQPISIPADTPPQSAGAPPKPRSPAPLQEQTQKNPTQKCRKIASERYSRPPLKKQEEPFVRSSTANKASLSEKKSKRTPLSRELLGISSPKKKDPSCQATTKLPTKQVSSSSSNGYERQPAHTLINVEEGRYDDVSDRGATAESEFGYVMKILDSTGVDKYSPVSFTRWYSASHPLDPLLFHQLERSYSPARKPVLNLRCNRKLIFQLVNEILAGILKPYVDLKPWIAPITRSHRIKGSELIETVCERIRGFPAADCRVLEDIDRLVAGDLGRWEVVEEEGEAIVAELEKELVEGLVVEVTAAIFGGGGGDKWRTWSDEGHAARSRDEMRLAGCGLGHGLRE